jgi:hypothetical protein
MNACESGKRLSGKGSDLVSCDTVQVIRGEELVRKVLSSQSSDGQTQQQGFRRLKATFTPHESHASLDEETF